MDILKKYNLRERKHAETKVSILKNTLKRLKDKDFEEITVKEICEEAMISEVTFFNYFPSKDHLLTYYIQMWSIDVSYHVDRELDGKSGLEEIDYIFNYTADIIVKNPNLMTEIIAFVTKNFTTIRFVEISEPEKILMFEGHTGIEKYKPLMINELFGSRLHKSVQLGELPEDTDIESVSFSMVAIFFGVPIGWTRYGPERISRMYSDNLRLLWNGLRARK